MYVLKNCPKCTSNLIIKKGFKKLKTGNRYYKYQRFQCKKCNHYFILKDSKFNGLSFQAKVTFEYLLKRSVRNIQTSQVVGQIGKAKILETVLSVSNSFPEIANLNQRLDIQWSGQFALDATFFKLKGKSFAVLLCSDFHSLDLIGYHIAQCENYHSWLVFLHQIYSELTKNELTKFFVTDGKKGLHKAVSRLFPNIPLQLCTTINKEE